MPVSVEADTVAPESLEESQKKSQGASEDHNLSQPPKSDLGALPSGEEDNEK